MLVSRLMPSAEPDEDVWLAPVALVLKQRLAKSYSFRIHSSEYLVELAEPRS